MPDYMIVTIVAVALVAGMWASGSVSEQIGLWRQERKRRREYHEQLQAWLVNRISMREDRHRTGVDNGDGF